MGDTSFVKEKLIQYGLESLTDIFEENKIDESVWPFLQGEILKDLIPQVGLRIKFQQQFNLDQANVVELDGGNGNKTDGSEITEKSPEASLIGELSHHTGSASTESILSIEKGIIIEDVTEEQKNDGSNDDTTLKKLLESSPKGKYILGYYSIKKKLDDDSRNKLAELIIEHNLGSNPDKRLNRSDFINLASQISATFPGESKDIYFRVVLKRCPNGKFKKDGQGKLFSKYYNLRKSLKKVGLLTQEQGNEDTLLHEDDDQENSEESLCWLRNNIEPWGQVELFWRKTFKARQNELKHTPIYNYYTSYRVLRENRGFTLFENDFNSLYPESDMNLYANWPDFSRKILENAKKTKDKNIENLLSVHDNATDEDVKSFAILKILPNLLRTQTVSKKYKPSKQEVQQAFIFHIKRIEDLQINLEERKKKLCHLGLTFQPTPIVIATSEDAISECFVAVNDVLYNVCTPLKAVELCFKIIHALNAQYPPEAEHIWLCIQKGIFKISSKYDKSYTSVNQFLED